MRRVHLLLRALLASTHVALVVVLVAIGAPRVAGIAEQLASGYVPTVYSLVIAMVAATFGVVLLVLIGLVERLRRSRSGLLLIADVVAWSLGWSVFTLFVFGTDLAIVQFVLAPICSAIAAIDAVLDGRRSRTSEAAGVSRA